MSDRALLLALVCVALEAQAAGDGKTLARKLECARCHELLGVAPPPPTKQCVGCHRAILEGRFAAPADALDEWRRNLHSLNAAPSLVGAGRLRRSWVRAFLLRPIHVRPMLPASMPRLPITEAEAVTLAAWLAPADEADDLPALPHADGERLYRALACGTCHRMSGAPVDGPVHAGERDAIALAPDLAFARERLRPGAIAAMIRTPPAGSLMPAYAISPLEAERLESWLRGVPLVPRAPVSLPARLPILERRVGFDEVNERVFRKSCWHCHSQPDYALGDGGPGNSGGFGHPRRGLDLSTAEAAQAGALGPDHRRRSIFRLGESGEPHVIERLLLRQREAVLGEQTNVPGMPLGLPPLDAEQLQLVESWVAQGRPQ